MLIVSQALQQFIRKIYQIIIFMVARVVFCHFEHYHNYGIVFFFIFLFYYSYIKMKVKKKQFSKFLPLVLVFISCVDCITCNVCFQLAANICDHIESGVGSLASICLCLPQPTVTSSCGLCTTSEWKSIKSLDDKVWSKGSTHGISLICVFLLYAVKEIEKAIQ